MKVTMNPSEKQWAFQNDKHRYAAYGGARGGGKSWIVRLAAISYAQRYPKSKQLIVRKTYPEVIGNHVTPMTELLGKAVRYNKTDKIMTFPNGSTIKFGYYGSEQDGQHYQGLEFDAIWIDECTNLQEEWLKKLIACNRGVNDFPKIMRFTCNPGGPSHGYIKRLFVDRKFMQDEDPENYSFIQAQVSDNRALMETMPEYAAMLRNLPPKLRKAWLEGSWDIYSGQFFEQFRNNEEGYETHQWTHVIPAFKPPGRWQIWRSMDWGYGKPFSIGYYAYDPIETTLYRIAELYGCQKDVNGDDIPNEGVKWTPNEVFAACQRMEREHPYLAGRRIFGVADPAMWDAQTGISIAETADKYGIWFEKADNTRIGGWMQCQWRLRFDADGYPKFYCFDTCTSFIRTIPLQQHDERNVEDLDTKQEDHIADEWRYICNRHMLKLDEVPEATSGPKQWLRDPIERDADRF